MSTAEEATSMPKRLRKLVPRKIVRLPPTRRDLSSMSGLYHRHCTH
jgi:hypothetical protein